MSFCFTDELLSLHRGQGLDILWRDTLQCPSEEEYISMANGSTYRSSQSSLEFLIT